MTLASPIQEQIWLAENLSDHGSAYVTAEALLIDGLVDVDRLAKSLSLLALRHEALRTSFAWRGRGVVQLVAEQCPISLAVDTIRPTTSVEGIRQRLCERLRKPIPLEAAPLWYCVLWAGGGKSVVMLALHHIIADGHSLDVLLHELDLAYSNQALPAPSLSYLLFSREARAAAASNSYQSDLGWWRRQVNGMPARPSRSASLPPATHVGGRVRKGLTEQHAAAVERWAVSNGASVFAAYLVLAMVSVGLSTGRRDLLVGVPFGNRPPGYEDTVGAFANLLPIRMRLTEPFEYTDLLHQVVEELLGAFSHQAVSLGDIIRTNRRSIGDENSPLFQAICVPNQQTQAPRTFDGAQSQLLDLHNGGAKYEFAITVPAVPGVDSVSVEFDEGALTREIVTAYLNIFRSCLEAIAGISAPEVVD